MKIRDPRVMLVCAALLVTAASGPANAQRQGTFVLGGGVNIPVSEEANYLKDGGTMFVAGGRRLSDHNTIQVEWNYNWLSVQPEVIERAQSDSVQLDNAYAHSWSITLNYLRHINPHGNIKPWFTGGAGYYKRTLEITQTALFYYPPVWDPWWGWIGGGWAPGEVITGSRDASGFGVNVGGGIDLAIDSGAALFVEARYHFASLDGVDITMVPILFGIRW